MWGASEEPPGTMEGGPPEPAPHVKEKCEQNKNQLESLKEIMLKNKQSLKKKEEEVQEYARRLSKIKSRAKLSRRSKEGGVTSMDTTQLHKSDAISTDIPEESIDDISQAKTPKAKSTLLQKKLAENRKAFEQRSKEMTETKRAVEEKVEAIRQQLEEKDAAISALQKDQLTVNPVKPVVVTSDIMSPIQIENIQEKENKIVELSNRILELEATVLDLQENLKEKDSVIESKTRAVTLMSADLSRKGKTTLDTLEDTKDEMRTMQQHFVLMETSLKNKNDSLLDQLQYRDNKITHLHETIESLEKQLSEQKLSETASADFSRSTMDALVETKDNMKSMQENFVLIETALKAKNDNLLQQLQDYELKLAEANERIFKFEAGVGIVKDPKLDDLEFKLQKLEQNNKQLQDEKYELQKNISDMQDKIINRSVHGNGAIMEKDNRIAELENLVEELKQSNTLLEEESKAELQKQLADITLKNEEYSNKITDLEKLVNDLEAERNDAIAKIPDENSATKESEKVAKLSKELEELNKSMIKIKAQHRSKLKNLQKQLENFKMVSDSNAELVRLGNQVALLEEEKGNLQLSLVDFDELKASAGDWQERIAELESKVSAQTNEIQMHIEAIATLENQKLDLMQELHTAKQEVSTLEAENAESENLRVTAEMKVVDLEEQLEAIYKGKTDNKTLEAKETNESELLQRIEVLTQENSELYSKITKLEEKSSDTGSTGSFEAIQESDKNDLLKKVQELTEKNNELTVKLNKFEEKSDSHAGSTESFETINDLDKTEMMKKIDQLTQENVDLTMKLSRFEEKGSSDTGSTESFERIPEHNESMTKIELLTQENNELVIKLTKLEEQLESIKDSRVDVSESKDIKLKMESLLEENSNQSSELSKLRAQVEDLIEENAKLEERIKTITMENNDLVIMYTKLEERLESRSEKMEDLRLTRETQSKDQIDTLIEEKSLMEKEIKELHNELEKFQNVTPAENETSDLKTRIEELSKENARVLGKISELEESNKDLKDSLNEVTREREELQAKINELMPNDDFAKERLELIDRLERINQEKKSVAQERQELHEQISTLLHKSAEESPEIKKSEELISPQTESMLVSSLEREIEECKRLIAEQTSVIEEMKIKLADKERELEEKGKLIVEYETSGKKAEELEEELKEMLNTIEEWKHKCSEMQEQMAVLEAGKASIEEGFRKLESEKETLLVEQKEKDRANDLMKQQLEDTIANLESNLQEKYTQLQNEMIFIDNLQEELNSNKALLQQKDSALSSLSADVDQLNESMRSKDEEIHSLKKEVRDLHETIRESKSLEEYNELLEHLRNKDMYINELQCKIDDSMKENKNLLMKMENLTQHSEEVENQLSQKQQEMEDLLEIKRHLQELITEAERGRNDADRRVSELENLLEDNSKFMEGLQVELNDAYKKMEELKAKHIADMEMQIGKFETLSEELQGKTRELEVLKSELQEKERLVGQNVTEEMKVSLEVTVAALQKELSDAKDKIQAQLEKMKKIAANLKKKTVMCQELEARVAELEEKWTTEKDEKEAKNKKIQEVESLMREKDNKIADLEEKLLQAGNELTDANVNIEKMTNDITISKDKLASLVGQITELEEENTKLRTDINAFVNELQSERESKENVQLDYDSFRQQVFQENERKQLELDDVKEKARELSVRMQVMESEYVEQLTLINNLRAENGMLLSKQTQINEKLENAEKESDERRVIIEQIQKEAVGTVMENTQRSEPINAAEKTAISGAEHCDHCKQCQTLVQALEAKLQEREAEIEKLDNELANSNDNFAQMHEALRMNDATNQSTVGNISLENPYNELLMQYNALASSNEEMKVKLEDTLKENDELMQKIESLQSINSTLEERIASVIQELEEGKVIIEKLQTNDTANADTNKKYEAQQVELSNVEKELQNVRERSTRLEEQLNSELFAFEAEKQELSARIKSLSDTAGRLEQEIESLKAERDLYQQRMAEFENELKVQKEGTSLEQFPANNSRDEQDNTPQLFDASKIFGAPTLPDSDILANKEVSRLQNLLAEKEAQCFNLTQEIEHFQKLMIEEKSQLTENYNRCSEELQTTQEHMRAARVELERLESIIIEKDSQISSLNLELNNRNDTDAQFEAMTLGKDIQIEELSRELNITKERLESVIMERDQGIQLLESLKPQIANVEAEEKNMTDTELIQDLEHRISVTQQERNLLQLQVNDLSMSMQELKDSLDHERNIQNELENAVRERDEAKEAVANLTRTLEEYYKTSKVTDNQTVAQKSLDETTVSATQVQPEKAVQPVEENIEQVMRLDVGSAWDSGSNEKLNVDEETWGWNEEDLQLAGDQQITTRLIPNEELQLRTKIEELEDRIRELESEREKIMEENKVVQVRSGKMIKKLKEYKVQVESLQQQLKMQKSTSDFYDLDSAIEEELKSQITALEKSLSSLKEEYKRSIAEKEGLLKRLDNITSANERYAEINERQEMDMEVLRIQNRELNNKIEILNERLQGNAIDSEHKEEIDNSAQKINQPLTYDQPRKRSIDNDEFEALSKKYKDEIDDLKDEMEALASENEQLQQFLEEQKLKMATLESTKSDDDEAVRTIDKLNTRITELEGTLSKTKEEYDVLRKQYEQSLMDANDHVSAMRQNTDLVQAETFEKISKLEMEVNKLQQQLEASETHADELQRRLDNVLQEKAVLEEKVSALSGIEEKLSSVSTSLAEVTDLLNIRVQEVVDLKQELQRQYIDREESEGRLQTFVQALTQEVKEKKQELESLKQSFTNKEKELIQQQSLETASNIVSEATQELVQKHTIEIEEKDKEIRNLIDKISKLQSTLDGHSLQTQSDVERYHSQEKSLELLQQSLIEKDSILETIQFNFLQTKEELNKKESELSRSEEELQTLKFEVQKYLAEINDLQRSLNESQVTSTNLDQQSIRVQNLEREVDDLRSTLLEKEAILERNNQEQLIQLETYEAEVTQLRVHLEEMKVLKNELQEKTDLINNLNSELDATREALEETRRVLSEKISLLENTNQQLNEKRQELSGLSTSTSEPQQQASTIVDGLPLFRMSGDNTEILPNTLDDLKAELERKQEEIDHLKYVLNENTYPSIIREMQDRINCLYNEKSELESSLAMASQTLTVKEKHVEDLKLQIEAQSREIHAKEELNSHTRERRSLQDQEEVVRLQNQLHIKEQEINELKYIIAEKDSQLSLQASMEPQSDDFELREMVQRLTTELYGKEQEVQLLRMTVTDFQREVSRLEEFEILTTESKEAIHRLTSEKEHVRLEAEEHLERILREKEMEIGEIKERLQAENQKILDELQLKENDVQNLMRQIEELSLSDRHANDRLHEKEDELLRVNADLAEKERRLAELSITKDTELHNLKVQIHEKEVRIEELLALSEEEEKQLVELKNTLDARETEVNALKKLLEDKVAEYEMIQHALRKDVPIIDTPTAEALESASSSERKEPANQELDFALYMLHQRDVRCEELTHELMQLLEERDTLQLRLSNAIRINEELRRTGNTDLSLQKEASTSSETEEPLIEHPSPSRSEGPVEIAKEAIDSPIGEDKEALAQKLSQLHTVNYAKDVRLKDERELRHTQQMSLLAHKDVLSTLPPEAAARLVNANYTLSRDVQSQSSVLLNWLWGKREYGNVSQV